MKPKKMRDLASVLPEMFGGWRMGADLERMSDLPDGALHLDLLRGTALHSSSGPVDLWIAGELSAWLKHRLEENRIPPSDVEKAELDISISTSKIATDKKRIVSFDFKITSCITAWGRTFGRTINDKHAWHTRLAKKTGWGQQDA